MWGYFGLKQGCMLRLGFRASNLCPYELHHWNDVCMIMEHGMNKFDCQTHIFQFLVYFLSSRSHQSSPTTQSTRPFISPASFLITYATATRTFIFAAATCRGIAILQATRRVEAFHIGSAIRTFMLPRSIHCSSSFRPDINEYGLVSKK